MARDRTARVGVWVMLKTARRLGARREAAALATALFDAHMARRDIVPVAATRRG